MLVLLPIIETEASVKTKEFVSAMTISAFLVACASASYKPREEGFTNFGYEETKVSDHEYLIDYYGAKSDTFSMLEALWRKRAEEVCQSKNYQASFEVKTYEGKTFILLPPFVYYDKEGWPLLKGRLACAA